MNKEQLITSILTNMSNVSVDANPDGYMIAGTVGFKTFVDTHYGENPDLKAIWDDDFDGWVKTSFETFCDYYNNNKPVEFWVYDRYDDGSFKMYTLYSENDDNFDTIEINVDKIYNFEQL